MKPKILLPALILSATVLCSCVTQDKSLPDQTDTVETYEGFDGIPDLGASGSFVQDEELAKAAACRLGVPDNLVRAYIVTEQNAGEIDTWVSSLQDNGYYECPTVFGNETIVMKNAAGDSGVMYGYYHTDSGEQTDRFLLMLADPSLYKQYIDLDYNSVVTQWCNENNDGMVLVKDGWIYGATFNDNGYNVFMTERTNGQDRSILNESHAAVRIGVSGEYIYMISLNTENGANNSPSLARCKLGGNEYEELTPENISARTLQVQNGKLYYCAGIQGENDVSDDFFRFCDLDGSNGDIALEKEIYYPYVIGAELYYQDDKGGEFEHCMNLLTMQDVTLTADKTYGFVRDNECAYYICNDNSCSEGDYIGTLNKIDLSTGDITVLYDTVDTASFVLSGDTLFFSNPSDGGKVYGVDKNGDGIRLISKDDNSSTIYCYGDSLVYYSYIIEEDSKYIEGIYISSLDGSNRTQLNW